MKIKTTEYTRWDWVIKRSSKKYEAYKRKMKGYHYLDHFLDLFILPEYFDKMLVINTTNKTDLPEPERFGLKVDDRYIIYDHPDKINRESIYCNTGMFGGCAIFYFTQPNANIMQQYLEPGFWIKTHEKINEMSGMDDFYQIQKTHKWDIIQEINPFLGTRIYSFLWDVDFLIEIEVL